MTRRPAPLSQRMTPTKLALMRSVVAAANGLSALNDADWALRYYFTPEEQTDPRLPRIAYMRVLRTSVELARVCPRVDEHGRTRHTNVALTLWMAREALQRHRNSRG